MKRLDYYVYHWTNTLNLKVYIGRGRRHRANTHRQATCSSLVAKAIRKYGVAHFQLDYLECGLTHEEASERERYYIAKYRSRSPLGYNLTDGGEGAEGLRHSAETLLRLKEIARTRAPEHQEKLNAARRTVEGRALSAQLGARTKGSKRTPEQRARQSAAHLGIKPSPESIEKTRKGLLGRPKSAEHKRKLAEANTGKTQTAEVVAKRVRSQTQTAAKRREERRAAIEAMPAGPEKDEEARKMARADYMREYAKRHLDPVPVA